MISLCQVWEGLNVVKTGRVMLGETNPADSKPGTIRGDFCIQVGRWVPPSFPLGLVFLSYPNCTLHFWIPTWRLLQLGKLSFNPTLNGLPNLERQMSWSMLSVTGLYHGLLLSLSYVLVLEL